MWAGRTMLQNIHRGTASTRRKYGVIQTAQNPREQSFDSASFTDGKMERLCGLPEVTWLVAMSLPRILNIV